MEAQPQYAGTPPGSQTQPGVQPGLPDSSKRLRSIEQRVGTIQRQLQVNEQNLIATERKTFANEKTLREELQDVRKEISVVKDAINQIAKEVGNMASHQEVEVMKKYLDLWEPVKFVTQHQVERIIAEELGRESIKKEVPKN